MLSLLAGCHLFAQGAIDRTCEDLSAGCGDSVDDTAPPAAPANQYAMLTCNRTCSQTTDTGGEGYFVRDLWVEPAAGPLPEIASKTELADPAVAWDGQVAWVASGTTVVQLGPGLDDFLAYEALVDGDIIDIVATGTFVVLLLDRDDDEVVVWDHTQGRDGLAQAVATGDFIDLFADAEGRVWAVSDGGTLSLWQLEPKGSSATEVFPGVHDNAADIDAGMFSMGDAVFGGCSTAGALWRFDAAKGAAETVATLDDDAVVVGCAWDDGLDAWVAMTEDGMVVVQGADAAPFEYAEPPNRGSVLAGSSTTF